MSTIGKLSLSETVASDTEVESLVRHGLLELGRQRLARLDDDFARSHFDNLFDPTAPKRVTFKELAASRRRIPVHPELIAIGFLHLVKAKDATSRIFVGLKPDKHGNLATYAVRRFRETFLPDAIELLPRQTFYSFRHSFRDALRRFHATPDTLKAFGGWEQGSLTSDNYGDKSDPDYQAKFMAQIGFEGLDLSLPSSGPSLTRPKRQTNPSSLSELAPKVRQPNRQQPMPADVLSACSSLLMMFCGSPIVKLVPEEKKSGSPCPRFLRRSWRQLAIFLRCRYMCECNLIQQI